MAKKNEEALIAYCGLYCGDCLGYQGKVADLARDLRKELKKHRFEKMAEGLAKIPFFEVFKDYPQCYEVLGGLVKLRCKKTCRGKGGSPFCKIRECAKAKGLNGCWECDEFSSCEKLDVLKRNHGDAHIANLRKIKRNGPAAFVKGMRLWYRPIKTK